MTDTPVTITNVKSDGGWYGAEWQITIKRGHGPDEASKIISSDLPQDIRQGLIKWLNDD